MLQSVRALSVFNWSVCALTSTDSVTAPISSEITPAEILSFARTVKFNRSAFLNPGFSTARLYLPGRTCGKTKRPSWSVAALKAVPLSWSISVTDAFATAACCLSTTVPAIEPELVCAFPLIAITSSASTPVDFSSL